MLPVNLLSAVMSAATMQKALWILFGILGVLAVCAVTMTIVVTAVKKGSKVVLTLLWIATALALVCCVLCLNRYNQVTLPVETEPVQTTTQTTTEPTTEPTVPTTVETEPPTEPEPTFEAAATDNTTGSSVNIKWEIDAGGSIVDSFQRAETINFGDAADYYALPGVPSFRGNNYRNGATYGTAEVANQTLSTIWTRNVGGFNGWYGIGWTGQPLVVQWDNETKQHLGMFEEKKAKEGLVEVIATTLDGNIYFYDLEDGSYTREPLHLGMNVKGTASLDPRGWPLLYVGSGINYNGYPKMYVISLIENKVLYSQNGGDSFAKRGWYAFDSSPMISAEADTVIWPGESGVLYTIKLNSQYDPQAGTVSVAPETVVKTRYSSNTGRTVGYEASVIVVGKYAYVGDNGGLFFCIDLNTMALVWTQNVKDDVNATPVFEWGEDGNGYIYLGTSMEYGNGTSRIFKINAANGEIVWERAFDKIVYNKDVSGGVLSSPLLGQKGTDLEGMIFFAIGKTPNDTRGLLVALDTETGESIWEQPTKNYAWSSIVSFYTAEGKGYVVLGDSAGTVRLMDKDGNELSSVNLGSNIEASPVVFGNILVVGTRGGKVCGVKIS